MPVATAGPGLRHRGMKLKLPEIFLVFTASVVVLHAQAQQDLVMGVPMGNWQVTAASNGDLLMPINNTLYRLAPNGSILWSATYDGFDHITSVVEVEGGSLMLAGGMLHEGDRFIGLMRTEPDGTPFWARMIVSDTLHQPGGPNDQLWTRLLWAGGTRVVLLSHLNPDHRWLALFSGSGQAMWSRRYVDGNFYKDMATDSGHSKLYLANSRDVHGHDLLTGELLWTSNQWPLGSTIAAESIACNGDRVGVSFRHLGGSGGIVVLDTAGTYQGAVHWGDDGTLVHGNANIVALDDGFAVAFLALGNNEESTHILQVDTGLTTTSEHTLDKNFPWHTWASVASQGRLLLSGNGVLVSTQLSETGPCVQPLDLDHEQPALSPSGSSGSNYAADGILLMAKQVTMQPGETDPFTFYCVWTGINDASWTDGPSIFHDRSRGGVLVRHHGAVTGLRLYDVQGALVASRAVHGRDEVFVGLRDLRPGVYLAVAIDGQGRVLAQERIAQVD